MSGSTDQKSTPGSQKASKHHVKADGETTTPSEIKDAVKTNAERAADEATAAKDAAYEAASDIASDTKEVADDHVARATGAAAREFEDAARQTRETGDAFDAGSFASSAADQIAQNLSHAASAVRNTDLNTLQADLTAFARRNPLLFFGGAAVLGFATGRLLKASEQHEDAASDAYYSGSRASHNEYHQRFDP